MIIRNKILLFMNEKFGNSHYLNIFVLKFYKNIIIKFVTFYLKQSFSNLVEVRFRNSLNNPAQFNAFLSDIDIDLIVQDNTDYQKIVKAYLKLKSIFIMLDFPEIYFLSEYKKLEHFKKECGDLINLTWNIRKINWSLDFLKSSKEKIDNIKKIRSLKKSYALILKDEKPNSTNIYPIEHFKTFENFVPKDHSNKNLCYWSFFLETNKSDHLQILLTDYQYEFLHSLMPGENISPLIKDKISANYNNNKNALEFYELQLSKSSMRLAITQSKDTSELKKWIDYLESRTNTAEVIR